MYEEWQYHYLYRVQTEISRAEIDEAMQEMCFTSPEALAYRDGWQKCLEKINKAFEDLK